MSMSVIVQDCRTPADVVVIKLIASLSSWGKRKYHHAKKQAKNKCEQKNMKNNKQINTQTKQNKTEQVISTLPNAFMEDTIRYNKVVAKDTSKNLWH